MLNLRSSRSQGSNSRSRLQSQHQSSIADKVNYFSSTTKDYNEGLIRVFYSGLNEEHGSCFSFFISNKVYQFTNDLWKTLLGIIVGDADVDDEVDLLATDLYSHVSFDWSVHMNELLKAPRVEDYYDPITTGHLKMVPRILLWVVSHILLPKNGGFSRINNVEIHLVYILLHKVKINWPH
ncbi:uncharacterized protein LOC127082789 [Lathyrus oleraceus]|uniref:uncharacterized protein LOC127082789 n=1 Tax=Pisum sativum TaxID=3888 RepID=UPI0021D0FAC2|nr:uncharacterized protein LOC127082789 [Pisum sativum]